VITVWHNFIYLFPYQQIRKMNNLFRGLLAGGAAAKWGGGCFGTILVFVIVWLILGQTCS
jgi:hypothetical protein